MDRMQNTQPIIPIMPIPVQMSHIPLIFGGDGTRLLVIDARLAERSPEEYDAE